jgi:rhodanese-related sulfurtransferase
MSERRIEEIAATNLRQDRQFLYGRRGMNFIKPMLIVLIITFTLILSNTSCTQSISDTSSTGAQVISPSALSATLKDVSVDEAYKIIQDNSVNPDFIILDVRTSEEYNNGHIPNAVNIDVKSSDFDSTVSQLSRDKIYLVYCQMGGRSAKATQAMAQLSFKNILNLKEGFAKWVEKNYPVS